VTVSLVVHGQDLEERLELDDVVVTATRFETSPSRLGSSVTVIGAEQLAAFQIDTMLEALRLVPGIDVVQQSGPGSVASAFIRCHNSAQTKILLNGVRLTNNLAGSYDLSNILVNNVERIEIVRGPQSALYGSDAIAGVINIITKRGEQGFHGLAESIFGRQGLRRGALNLSGRNAVGDFSVGCTINQFEVASAVPGIEKDGWDNHTVSGRFGLSFLEDGRTDLFLNYGQNTMDLDDPVSVPSDDPNYEQDRETFAGKIEFSKPILEWYAQTLSLGWAWEKVVADDPDTSYHNFELTSDTIYVSAKADFFLFAGDTMSIGYDFERQTGENAGYDVAESIDLYSFFAQNHWTHGDILTLTIGIRQDDHENFGDEMTFRLAASAAIPDPGTRFHASWGTGFRAPTLNDLYWPTNAWEGGGEKGNPDLDPETNRSFDVGVEQTMFASKFVADVTYFRSDVEGLIDWNLDGAGWWSPINVAEAEIEGVEATLRVQPIPKVELGFSYAHAEHEDKSTGKELNRRAKDRFSATANARIWEKAKVNLSVIHTGKRYDDDDNAKILDPYTRVDLAASYGATEYLQVFGRVENLFDEEYEEVDGYPALGIGVFCGVRYSF